MIDEYFLRVFEQAPRQGPGSENETLLALSQCKELSKNPSILDIGCGKGMQSIALARAINGVVVALDMHKSFIADLTKHIDNLALRNKVVPIIGNMSDLPFTNEQFDLIWSEGAIYIMGHKDALKDWKKYIKKSGYLVFTDCVWLNDNKRPKELTDYWASEGLELPTIPEILNYAENENYKVINHFTLSDRAWKEEFYDHISEEVIKARDEYSGNEKAQKTFDAIEKEIQVYNDYNSLFGYEFFVLQV